MNISHPARLRLFPDAHHRLSAGVVLAAVVFGLLDGRVERSSQIIAAWDVFVLVDLALAWLVMTRVDPSDVRESTRLQDSSRTVIFALVLLAACAAFASVAFILGPSKTTGGGSLGLHVTLSVIAIVGSWFVVHTLFALRYAHLFYGRPEMTGDGQVRQGLLFPGTTSPNYLDFAYFSFVIGMTSQVSDVQICSGAIRHLALLHGILSFIFNVVILGLTISVMSDLL
jgi:uncharacterized membrane protein